MNPPICPACGARLAPGSTHCDLCGHVLGDETVAAPESLGSEDIGDDPAAESPMPDATTALPEPGPVDEDAPAAAPSAPGNDEVDGPFCVHCGAKNPDYARFCYNCGHALLNTAATTPGIPAGSVPVVEMTPVVPVMVGSAPATAQPEASARPDSDAGRRALTLVGVAVLAVLALYFITQASEDRTPTAPQPVATDAPPAVPQSAPAELSAEVAARAAALEDEIAAAAGAERVAKQEALARLYAQNGAFLRAATVQRDVAEAKQTALAWADAGSFYLAHMIRTQGPDRAAAAQQSADAYERSLAIDPNDLDVKTDLATAYLNDTQNPMQAVQTVKEVLAENPNHVRANFNYGLMLAQINRTDQALEQFQKVVGLTEPGDPVYERAAQELARLQAAQSGTASG